MSGLNHVLTDEDLAALRARNQERAEAVIQKMGRQYVCHPTNVLRANPATCNFQPAAAVPVQSVLPLRRRNQ